MCDYICITLNGYSVVRCAAYVLYAGDHVAAINCNTYAN